MTLLMRRVALTEGDGMRRVIAGLLAVLLVLTLAVGPATCLLAVLPLSADLLDPLQVTALAPLQEPSLARPSWRGSSSLDRGPPAAVFPTEEITTSMGETCCGNESSRRCSCT